MKTCEKFLKITEATGKGWEIELSPETVYSIGRADENDIVLNDRRVSRRHAQIIAENGGFKLIDGYFADGEIKRSVNRVFVNGSPQLEKILEPGDLITIGESRLEFEQIEEKPKPPTISTESTLEVSAVPAVPADLNYDDQPLGHTQMLMSASEIIGKQTSFSIETKPATAEEIKDLRRKAQILEMLYEMSKTLGTVFDLKEIFVKATDLIFRGTPAERVVALLADETLDGKILDYSLYPIAVKAREREDGEADRKIDDQPDDHAKSDARKSRAVVAGRENRRAVFAVRNQLFRKACVQRSALR